MSRIPVGILGATGTVGQRFVQLLADHPWFRVTVLGASDRSAGRRYADACHWLLPTPIPDAVRDLVVRPIGPALDCQVVFSALPSAVAGPVEERCAQAGCVVCSNSASHRLDADVPLLIPEVNPDHTALIHVQRRRRGWKGFVVTSANCSATQLALALKPLHDAFGLRQVSVVTMQAISGAGYPGVPAMDILDNVIPFISGEEDKVEREPLKLLGTLQGERVAGAPFVVSAQCNRVPVRDGHTQCMSVAFEREAPIDEVIAVLEGFRAPPEVANLPSSPARPIVVRREADRPQPVLDRDAGNGMSVSVGRVRPCPVADARFVVLGHNTLRGAAGGSIHNAELLVAQEWITPP
ncbi:MAG TPA: aspartate-semialdehyde dehydrogenase [Anaerolineae bacterium]|nr:aspartate-semialdehyde dehydrogenase [Anaerolineae bacterium]